MDARRRNGILCGLAAFGMWGVMPLYFVAIKSVSPCVILSHRIVWSVVLLTLILVVIGRLGEWVRVFRLPHVWLTLLLSALLLSVNWGIYIYGVATAQTVETSLGYFINPLLNVALGVLAFHERLRPAQILAIGLGALAVLILIVAGGQFPWIALSLATSFAIYGVIRKTMPVDAVLGLATETLLLLPIALGYWAFASSRGDVDLWPADWTTRLLVLASGAITTVPLLCFGQAARTVPLSMLGFMQFISPSMQFVFAVTLLGEPLSPVKLTSFICIWIGLAIYSIDAWRAHSKADKFVAEQVVESAAAEA